MSIIRNLFNWWEARGEREERSILIDDAERGAIALDIMLRDREWYGGVRVDEDVTPPTIEVMIADTYPTEKLSTFIPPRIGVTPVVVRFGQSR